LEFVPAGRERLGRLLPRRLAEVSKLRPVSVADIEQLDGLLRGQPLRVERSFEDWGALLAIPGVDVTLLEEHGKVQAYCVTGKGRDLQGCIHEWAGRAPEVKHLLQALATRQTTPLGFLSPDLPLPEPIEPLGVQPMAQMRILRPERFGSSDPVEVFGSPTVAARIPFYIWGLDSI
jgi:hypothetical protein